MYLSKPFVNSQREMAVARLLLSIGPSMRYAPPIGMGQAARRRAVSVCYKRSFVLNEAFVYTPTISYILKFQISKTLFISVDYILYEARTDKQKIKND